METNKQFKKRIQLASKMIDLCMKINNCTYNEALLILWSEDGNSQNL